MKAIKKLLIAGAAAAMAVSMVAMAGCGIKGDPYTFEAEDGELGGAAQVEEGKHFWAGSLDEQGDELTQVGYFTSEGATLTFTVKAEAAAKVELNFRLASATQDQSKMTMDYTTWAVSGSFVIRSIDFAKQKVVKLTVNDKEVEVKGKLPEVSIPLGEGVNFMAIYDSPMCNYQDVKVVVDLKEGENKIVLAATGYTEEVAATTEGAEPTVISYGVNIDKLIITSPVKLS